MRAQLVVPILATASYSELACSLAHILFSLSLSLSLSWPNKNVTKKKSDRDATKYNGRLVKKEGRGRVSRKSEVAAPNNLRNRR